MGSSRPKWVPLSTRPSTTGGRCACLVFVHDGTVAAATVPQTFVAPWVRFVGARHECWRCVCGVCKRANAFAKAPQPPSPGAHAMPCRGGCVRDDVCSCRAFLATMLILRVLHGVADKCGAGRRVPARVMLGAAFHVGGAAVFVAAWPRACADTTPPRLLSRCACVLPATWLLRCHAPCTPHDNCARMHARMRINTCQQARCFHRAQLPGPHGQGPAACRGTHPPYRSTGFVSIRRACTGKVGRASCHWGVGRCIAWRAPVVLARRDRWNA